MGLKSLNETCKFLGPLYSVQLLDGVEGIYRKFNDCFEFEVVGFWGEKAVTVNLWQRRPHTELLAIYSGIQTKEDLADTLGYLAFKYRNLSEKIQVEREDSAQ